ncbi:MAG: hypothetical protein AAGG69_06525 [Pseudomonadota bacterium]
MPKLVHLWLLPTFLVTGYALALTQTVAEEAPPSSSLSIELNAIQQLEDDTCRIIFVANNGSGSDIDKMSAETVLFNSQGSVNRFTLFDFLDLPSGKTRVRQFDLPNTECTSIARILINGASTCTVGGQDSDVCVQSLAVSTKTEVELLG